MVMRFSQDVTMLEFRLDAQHEYHRFEGFRTEEGWFMNDEAPAAKGRFEIEREGQISFLAYEIDGEGWISLLYTSVPPGLRGRGIANELARMALEYAKQHQLKVDVVCPVVFHYTTKHSEYKPLIGIRGYR
jgi:predicted GNAT family acetyltransferase